MNAQGQDNSQGRSAQRWLLLIHQLPPKPDYLRVKIRRRLHGLGAVLLKPTVYALPDTDDSREDFEWLIREIASEGGSAMLCRAEFLAGITDEEIRTMHETEAGESRPLVEAQVDHVEPGRTWVTRQGIKVDRIASAWLILRSIDPDATIRYVPATGHEPAPGELRFDMYEGEYTHEGDRCTFQTLLARFGLADPALVAIGEIVHDIDCKDLQFNRLETSEVSASIQAIVAATASDAERLERGRAMFDALHARLSADGRR